MTEALIMSDVIINNNKVTQLLQSDEKTLSTLPSYIRPQPDIYEQNRYFVDIITAIYGRVSSHLANSLAYNLEATCFISDTSMWSEFRIRREMKCLLQRYEYDSLQDWDNHVYGNNLNTIYLSKSQVKEIMDDRLDEEIHVILIEESNKMHPLFGIIIADNYASLMNHQQYQDLRDMDPDKVREQAIKLLKREARRQLRRNKYFSFKQWEDELKNDWQ